MTDFYDGTKLLSMKDINGHQPEIYMITSNRSAGKTTFFSRYFVNRFLKYGEKFGLLYRWKYELDDVSSSFFNEIHTLFFNTHEMTAKRRSKGLYVELFLDDKSCGYAFCINSANQLRNRSHLLSDIHRILFDEFQSETNSYVPSEVEKLLSIHISLARGGGKSSKYLPVFMCSNPVTLLNPYYVKLGISERLSMSTKFLRGNGWILEQGYSDTAGKALKESAFNSAFRNSQYFQYASEAVYLLDNQDFIESCKPPFQYLLTFKVDNSLYSIKKCDTIIYIDTSVDKTAKGKIAASLSDHTPDYRLLRVTDSWIGILRTYFNQGFIRFKNLQCKQAFYKLVSY